MKLNSGTTTQHTPPPMASRDAQQMLPPIFDRARNGRFMHEIARLIKFYEEHGWDWMPIVAHYCHSWQLGKDTIVIRPAPKEVRP